jgi:hypothetical protein
MVHDSFAYISQLSFAQLIGLAGFSAYLISFAMLQFKLIDGNGIAYLLMNLIAAGLVLFSLTESFNLASALIQVSWLVIGVCGLSLRLMQRKMRSASA